MKQTAVEFIKQHLFLDDNWRRIFQQAEEMEKQQIILSHIYGQSEYDSQAFSSSNTKIAEQYYNKTFKKGTE